MTALRVIVSDLPLDDRERAAILAAAGSAVDVVFMPAGERSSLAGVHAVAGTVGDAELEAAAGLRWIHLWSAGADRALTPGLLARRDIVLTASLGNGAIPLAEHALLLLLLLSRGGWRWAEAQRAHRWDHFPHDELAGRTLGIVGLGRAGRHLAGAAASLGMRVLGTRRTVEPVDSVETVYPSSRLHEMLAECDALVVTAPLTPETRGLLGEAEFRALRPGALYVNVSRGEIADSVALESAVREGRLGGAGLDAHHVEPLPVSSPLWDLPNVIVTPHNGSTSAVSKARALASFTANLERFGRGEPLTDTIDRAAGY